MAIIKVDDILLNTDKILCVREIAIIDRWKTRIYMPNAECIDLDGRMVKDIYEQILLARKEGDD